MLSQVNSTWAADLGLEDIAAKPLGADDPAQIGAFPLGAVLGSGGMGRVYLGLAPGRQYAAIKRIVPYLAGDQDYLLHFGRELDNQARLPTGVGARLLASDRTAAPPWFATEYIPGLTLTEAVAVHGDPLPVDALWLLLREAAAGLMAIHAFKLTHRDLKPSNVMLTSDGLRLIDFGIARAGDQSTLTRTGMALGTPAYMAPEQILADGQLTSAVDLFSLAGLLLYAVTGEPPFGKGSAPGLLYRVIHHEPDLEPVRVLDGELATVLEACFAKQPEDRPTAAALYELASARTQQQDPPVSQLPQAPQIPLWPQPVSVRISRRAEFAATAPDLGSILAVAPKPQSQQQSQVWSQLQPQPRSSGFGSSLEATPAGLDTADPTLGDSTLGHANLPIAGIPPSPIERPEHRIEAAVVPPSHDIRSPDPSDARESSRSSRAPGPRRSPRPPRSRRSRRLLVVMPVVVAAGAFGTYLGVARTPFTNSPSSTATSSTPSLVAPGHVSTVPSGSVSSSGAATKSPGVTSSASGSALSSGSASSGSTTGAAGSRDTATAKSTASAGPSPTASSIAGISGNNDTTQVPGSEADTDWVANDAACSAWLDNNGSGEFAGVLNTSLTQSCVAELFRSDGMAYTFSASVGAEKTNFISDKGYTMWICVWHADEQSTTSVCGSRFGVNGDTPVKE